MQRVTREGKIISVLLSSINSRSYNYIKPNSIDK